MRLPGIALGTLLLFVGGCINLPKSINVNVDGRGDSYRTKKPRSSSYDQPPRQTTPSREGSFFYGIDVLTPPNRVVELVTRINTNTKLSGIKVQYFSRGDSRVIGTGITDRDGFVKLRVEIGILGNYEFEARIASADKRELLELPRAQLFVACRKATAPVAVVDLDRTLMQSNAARVALLDGGRPMRGSVKVMSKVAKTYSIIYLTDNPEDLSRTNRMRLAKRGYPKGVLILAPGNRSTKHISAGIGSRLIVVKKDFPAMEIGIGNKLIDMQAFCRAGIRKPIWIPDLDRDDPDELREAADRIRKCRHRQVVVVQSWEDIDRAIFGRYSSSPKVFADRLDDHADYIEDQNDKDDDDDDDKD